MTLDGIMFDYVRFYPFAVMVGCVRFKLSVRPRILDEVVMNVVVKGGVFEFIGIVRTKNEIVLCESRQDWFEFVAMYNTQMTHANVTKKV